MEFDLSDYVPMKLNVYCMILDCYTLHRATDKLPLCIILNEEYKEWCYENNAKYYAEKDGYALVAAHHWLAAFKDDIAPALVLNATHLSARILIPPEILNIEQVEIQDHVEEIE